MGDLVPFQKAQKKTQVELLEEIASAINFDGHPFGVRWPYVYRTIEPSPGVRLILEETGDQELQEVPVSHLANRIVEWMRLQNVNHWFIKPRAAKEAVEFWQAISKPIPLEDVKFVRWQGEAGYTWRRLPWKLQRGETPTWNDLLSRMSNAQAFCDWLGSLFVEESSLQNYVWNHGLGNDGKGSVNRFLADVFGKAYRSKQPPKPNDRFWAYGLIGARIVVFPDCNNQSFVSSGLFKSLTGGDPVDVEAKQQMSFTAKLGCKFLFFSNERPNISSERADLRRIIYCEFTEPGTYDPAFEKKLWNEGGAFLAGCLAGYLERYSDHGGIITASVDLNDWVSTLEEEFEQVFADYLAPAHEAHRTTAGLVGLTDEQIELTTINPSMMQKLLNLNFKHTHTRRQFMAWLERTHGCRKRSIRLARLQTPSKAYTAVYIRPEKLSVVRNVGSVAVYRDEVT